MFIKMHNINLYQLHKDIGKVVINILIQFTGFKI